jgi:hypothetical protein
MWRKPRRPESSKPSVMASRASTPWHAVSITSKNYCCRAARALHSTRFLLLECPRLPLEQCSMVASCECFYRHHTDRRGLPRRRVELVGAHVNGYGGRERRLDNDRRKTEATTDELELNGIAGVSPFAGRSDD